MVQRTLTQIANERSLETSYWDRVERVAGMLRPSTVFVTPTEVETARGIIYGEEHRTKSAVGMTRERARDICSACVHPQTRDVIFTPLRLSWILPMNCMVTTVMVQASLSGSLPAIAFSQFLNQSYNVTHYYANRNISERKDNEKSDNGMSVVAASYLAATSISVAGALGIEKIARTSKYAKQLRYVGPFTAVACATFVNMGLMRQEEITKGVEIRDKYGDIMGTSSNAGTIGIGISCAGRIITAICPMILPTIISEKAKVTFLRPYPMLHIPFFLATIAGVIQATTPYTLGLFRQHTFVGTQWLEPKFKNHRMKDGKIAEEAYFNRGM